MKLIHLLFAVLACSSMALAQPKVDSLERVLATAKGDLKVKTLNELFRAYLSNDPIKAIEFTREALSLATEIDDKKGMAASYNNLGIAYKNQGALDKSLEYYLISLQLYDGLQNKEGIATTKNNIGNIYSFKKDYGQAMKYFEESHNQFMEINDKQKIIGSMNNLGNLHSDLQLYEQALKYYTEAYQLSQQSGKVYADPLNNIGNLYFKQGNYQRAVEYYKQALALARKENDQLVVLNVLSSMGEVFARAGQFKNSQAYLDSAMELSAQMHAFIFEPSILKSMALNYSKQGKMKEAYETMVRYDLKKEKIYGEESSRKIAQMEIALDLQEKEKEMEIIKTEAAVKSLELQKTRMVITIVILVIGLVLGGLNLVYSKRKSITAVKRK
jgi:tetratricopeptide (TPR) repeat protein